MLCSLSTCLLDVETRRIITSTSLALTGETERDRYQVELRFSNLLEFYDSFYVNTVFQNIVNPIWTASEASISRKRANKKMNEILETAAVRLTRKDRCNADLKYKQSTWDENSRRRNRSAKHLKHVTKAAVLVYEQRIATNPDTKVFWKYVTKSSGFTLPFALSTILTQIGLRIDPKEMCGTLAVFFG